MTTNIPVTLTPEQYNIWQTLNQTDPAKAQAYVNQVFAAQQQPSAIPPPPMSYQQYSPQYPGYYAPPMKHVEPKSKGVAALLAFFLGFFGAHKFYLGYTNAGITMIILWVISFILSFVIIGMLGILVLGIICIIEGITYLCCSDEEFQRRYVLGRKPWF
jgi:TM2 domain-containing membrane protein YozV